MKRSNHRAICMALVCIVPSGCVVDREVGALTGLESTTSSTSGGGTTGADDTSSGDDDAVVLDLGGMDIPVEECASVEQSSTIEEGPSDILIVVDQSVSHEQHEATFQNFSLLIANDSIDDVRVAMLAGYPADGGGVCIQEAPLGVGECPANDDNPPMYSHFDETIEADTLLSQILSTHDQWGATMRPDAWKHLWIVSHADASMDTDEFVEQLRALDEGFERLTVHAMVPSAPEVGCSSVVPGVDAGDAQALQALAMSTGGVFEPLCNYSVKTLFEQMLDRIQEVSLSCTYDIPMPPDGKVFDKDRVNVDYDDGFGLQTIGYVPSVADCPSVSNGWYYDDPILPTSISMCPQTCGRFAALDEASIEIRFGCMTTPAA